MTTVVLLGYSCAGKSRIAGEVCKRWPTVESLDSDAMIAEPYGGHIYQMFFSLGRAGALDQIERSENDFLDSVSPSDNSRVIAAGPNLPNRVRWPSFVRRVDPTFIYLVLTPEEECEALLARRAQHSRDPAIAKNPLFGSWDEGLTTSHQADGVWKELDQSTALQNIETEMAPSTLLYERYTPVQSRFTKEERWNKTPNPVVLAIGHLLNLA